MKPLTYKQQQLLIKYYMKENKRLRNLILAIELEDEVNQQQLIDHNEFYSVPN